MFDKIIKTGTKDKKQQKQDSTNSVMIPQKIKTKTSKNKRTLRDLIEYIKSQIKKLVNALSDGILASILWKADLSKPGPAFFKRLFYLLVPFILVIILGCLIFDKALNKPCSCFYSFADDYTTTFTVCFLYFFMYYINGIFIYHFNRTLHAEEGALSSIVPSPKYKNGIIYSQAVVTILSFLLSFVSIIFLDGAKHSGGNRYWFNAIDDIEYILYCVLVIITLYSVLRVALTIILNSFHVFVITSKAKSRNNRINLHVLYNYFSVSLGVGICIIISAGMFIYSDYIASTKFHLNFTLHYALKYCIAGLLISLVIYFGAVILSWLSVLSSTYKIPESNRLSSVSSENARFTEKISSFWTFILTALIPGIAALIQLIIPLSQLLQKLAP